MPLLFTNTYILPVQEDAAGKLSVIVPADAVITTVEYVASKVTVVVAVKDAMECAIDPLTCKVEVGAVVPTPTLPALVIRSLSILLVMNGKSYAVVVPIVLDEELTALPLTSQA